MRLSQLGQVSVLSIHQGRDGRQVTPRVLSPGCHLEKGEALPLVLGGPRGLCLRDICGADPWDPHATWPAVQGASPQVSPPPSLRSP